MADLVQRKPNCCTALRSSSGCLLDKRTQVKAAAFGTCTHMHSALDFFFFFSESAHDGSIFSDAALIKHFSCAASVFFAPF